MCQFSRLTAKIWTVLRLTVNHIETLRCGNLEIMPLYLYLIALTFSLKNEKNKERHIFQQIAQA